MIRRIDKNQEIVVRRRAKKGQHEEHGGAWKVAFADFTLAMMALFMVLWIVHPQTLVNPPATGMQQANPLVDGGVGIFDGGQQSPVDFEGIASEAKVTETPIDKFEEKIGAAKAGEQAPRRVGSQIELLELAELIRQVSGKLDALANIEVAVVPQGLRILIKDDQRRFMFERGSANLESHFRQLLAALSGVLVKVENKLIISGHTDATPFRGKSGYDNWNLSGDRALRARNVMVESGLPAHNVLQVAAQADVMPVNPEDPKGGANRRIELLVLTAQAEQLYRQLFGEAYPAQVHYSQKGANFIGEGGAAPASQNRK